MGQNLTTILAPHLWRQDEPDSFAPYKYDPRFGFEDKEPRKEKQLLATDKEMDSANLELEARDFCAHLKIEFRGCIEAHYPFWFQCKGLYNELGDCYEQERVHDMKEFEREKRLNARERRIKSGQFS